MTTDKKLNSGRIVDYLLGGTHHFPADREAANRLLALSPDYPGIFREVRGFFGKVARYMHAQHVNRFLVFGAGIPTLGAVHEVVPGAKVLYSDIDRDNVEFGQQILADHPHCNYVYCDVTDLSSLDRNALNAGLGTEGSLGLMLAGVACFIEDDLLQQALEQLFEMAPPNSYFAIDFDSFGMPHDTVKRRKYMLRTPDTIRPLLGRWQPTPHGILPISLWQGDQIDAQDPGEPVSHYGVVLTK